MGRVKARKGETSGVRPARAGEGNQIRELLADLAQDDDDDKKLLTVCCMLLDQGIDTVRFEEPFRLLVFERRRKLLGAALIQAGNLGTRPGDHLAEVEGHPHLYAQQVGMQRAMFARINAVTAHLAFLAVAPEHRGQGIGRQIIRGAAELERKRGRRMLTGYAWNDDLARMYEKWGFIISPPDSATFFLREKVGNLHAPSAGVLNLAEGSRLIVLPLVPDVHLRNIGSEDEPFPALVGIEESFDPQHLEIPEELNRIKQQMDAFIQQQMALYGPERTRAMFDAFLAESGR